MNEKIVRYKGTTVVTYSSYLSKNQRRENAIFKNILMVLKKKHSENTQNKLCTPLSRLPDRLEGTRYIMCPHLSRLTKPPSLPDYLQSCHFFLQSHKFRTFVRFSFINSLWLSYALLYLCFKRTVTSPKHSLMYK